MVAQRTLPVNGVLIRSLREARGLTVEKAAKESGYSARTWQQLEAGKLAFRRTIRDIAQVLEVPPEVVTLDSSFDLRSEIEMFGSSGFGSAVLTINQTYLRASTAELLYGLTILFDMSGDSDSAALLCQSLSAITRDAKQRAAGLIRLAAIHGHQNRNNEGLKILRLLEKELRAQKPVDRSLLHWARYQAGVLFLAANRIDEAERILQGIAEGAPIQDQRTSARHQLGVIALRRGLYREAQRLFSACLNDRPPASFRRAFEYRRIGEACALDGRKNEAIRALREGIRIARKSGFRRYEQEILKTAAEVGLDSDPSWQRVTRVLSRHPNDVAGSVTTGTGKKWLPEQV